MSNKQQYAELCTQRPDIPLFMQAWWLYAVCVPENKEWDVLLYKENGKIIGAMPYHLVKKYCFKLITQPKITQYNGVWIDYPEGMKLHKRYSFENQVIGNLINQLEKLKLSHFSQNFHHSFTNWQPFYWCGFRQTTRYTYQIKNLSNLDTIFKDFSDAKQRHIKKENNDLIIDFSLSADEFYNFHKQCLQQKNAKIEYSYELFLSVYNETIKREQGKIIALKDKNNNIHSTLFIVWDKNSAYAYIYSINPKFKNNGTSTKMFWEAIKFVSDKTQVFDFEGSMIKNIAQSYLQFGTEQVPYFNISKSYSKLFSLLKIIKIKIYGKIY